MTGEQVFNAIATRFQRNYEIERIAAGYEGQRWEVQQSRQYADTSMYMTIRGDCPDHEAVDHYDCRATVTVRLSDHAPGKCQPDFNLYFGNEDEDGDPYDNDSEMQSIIAAVEDMPHFDAEADETRCEEAKQTPPNNF